MKTHAYNEEPSPPNLCGFVPVGAGKSSFFFFTWEEDGFIQLLQDDVKPSSRSFVQCEEEEDMNEDGWMDVTYKDQGRLTHIMSLMRKCPIPQAKVVTETQFTHPSQQSGVYQLEHTFSRLLQCIHFGFMLA